MFNFENKVVLITGSSGGIGRVIAQKFSGNKAVLALNDIPQAKEGLESLVSEIEEKDGKAKYFLADVTKFEEVGKMMEDVKKEFGKYSAEIEPQGVEILINFAGNNLWQLSNEIKKLVFFKRNQKIEIKDVEFLVRPKIETDIFKTIDAIAVKNKKRALELIHKHLEKGDSPLYLFSMINFQFRNLLIIKDLIDQHKTHNTILSETKLHPFIIKKSYLQIKKFDLGELKKIYQKIFQVDLAIKTGKVEPETALDMLVTEVVFSSSNQTFYWLR